MPRASASRSRLFDEGRRRHERGEDVVIAAMQPEIGRRRRGSRPGSRGRFRRATSPAFPSSTCPPSSGAIPASASSTGSRTTTRPAAAIGNDTKTSRRFVEHGISVLTSINLEYIAEQQDFVRAVIGAVPAETVPRASSCRPTKWWSSMRRRNGHRGTNRDGLTLHARLAQQLSQLRERALLLTADVVDRQLEAYLELHGIESSWGTQERILVCMTPRADATAMLASGRRNADRFHGELFAIYVNQPNLTSAGQHRERAEHQGRARANAPRWTCSTGRMPSPRSSHYAREHGITQLFVGHNLRRGWRNRVARQPARSADPGRRRHRRARVPAS